ncbi:hypothetical protein NHX12_015057, partial [Muraenolepis orangiensis]
MTDRTGGLQGDSSRTQGLLFLAAFSQALGLLGLLACCGGDYWLLAWQTCSTTAQRGGLGHLTPGGGDSQVRGGGGGGGATSRVVERVMVLHEGLFWRCSFQTNSQTFSLWDFWTDRQSLAKVCERAFLFPFPVYQSPERPLGDTRDLPPQPSEPDSIIVFRTFWSSFLVVGVVSVAIGGLVVLCAAPLSNHRLYKVGGAFQLTGGLSLMAVVLMFLMWFEVLGVLEQYGAKRRATACPAFHMSVELGPSFLLAPVTVFFSVLAGLLFVLIGREAAWAVRDKARKGSTQCHASSDQSCGPQPGDLGGVVGPWSHGNGARQDEGYAKPLSR